MLILFSYLPHTKDYNRALPPQLRALVHYAPWNLPGRDDPKRELRSNLDWFAFMRTACECAAKEGLSKSSICCNVSSDEDFKCVLWDEFESEISVNIAAKAKMKSTFEIVRAGLHCSFRISKHILPCELTFGWYTLVWNCTLGGLKG